MNKMEKSEELVPAWRGNLFFHVEIMIHSNLVAQLRNIINCTYQTCDRKNLRCTPGTNVNNYISIKKKKKNLWQTRVILNFYVIHRLTLSRPQIEIHQIDLTPTHLTVLVV